MFLEHDENIRETHLIIRENYSLSFEVVNCHPFVHLYFTKADKDTVKDIKDGIQSLFGLLGSLGYPILYTNIKKNRRSVQRFVERLGAKKVGEYGEEVIYEIQVAPIPEFMREVA